MSRVLLISNEPLLLTGNRMAGLQVRISEMARALMKKGHEVIVAEPSRSLARAQRDGITLIDTGQISTIVPVDIWIAHPLVALRYHHQLRLSPLVVDGYEAPFGSFLAHAAALLSGLGSTVMYSYRDTMVEYLRALSTADRVICANDRQRILYLTLLCVLGRINPGSFTDELVITVQSGAPADRPPTEAPEAWGVDSREPVVLWAGGCYPWFDVDTYLQAMPMILREEPRTRFLFVGLGGRDHTDHSHLPEGLANRVVSTIGNSPELKAASVFVGWLPYPERGRAYAVSTVGVCTYGDHIETLFSMRTRILDMIWGGLPIVASRGDSLSDYLERNGAAISVQPRDPSALSAAVVNILHNRPLRNDMAHEARRLAQTTLAWDQQVEDLHQYCLSPRVDSAKCDPLTRKTAARIVSLNSGPLWKARSGWHRLRRAMRHHFS